MITSYLSLTIVLVKYAESELQRTARKTRAQTTGSPYPSPPVSPSGGPTYYYSTPAPVLSFCSIHLFCC